MIQRIQSLFLLVAACAMAMLFLFPIATYQGENTFGGNVTAELNLIPKAQNDMLNQIAMGGDVVIDQQSANVTTWPLAVLAVVVLALTLVCIFLFKNRMLQVRLVAVTFLLNVVYIFLVFFWAVDSFDEGVRNLLQCSLDMSYTVATWSPCLSVVFLLLAQRAIKRDEAKVRAADRLR